MGGLKDCGFGEESPIRLAGFITVRASHGKPTQTHMNTHVFSFMGPSRGTLIISSHAALKIFHTIFFTLSPFWPLTLLYIFFFLTPIQTLSLSSTLQGFLSAGLLSDRKGFVRCQIPELRDQRQTKRLVTYCSVLERQKNGIPHRPGHCILPLFSPSSSFTHSILLSGFSLFSPIVSLSPAPIPIPVVSKLKHVWRKGGKEGGGGGL